MNHWTESINDQINDHVFISVTELSGFRNHIISKFVSQDHLLQVVSASSSIPGIQDNCLRTIKNQYYIDGGFTNNTPVRDSQTIIVHGVYHSDGCRGFAPSKTIGHWIRGTIGFVTVPDDQMIDEMIELGYQDMKDFMSCQEL